MRTSRLLFYITALVVMFAFAPTAKAWDDANFEEASSTMGFTAENGGTWSFNPGMFSSNTIEIGANESTEGDGGGHLQASFSVDKLNECQGASGQYECAGHELIPKILTAYCTNTTGQTLSFSIPSSWSFWYGAGTFWLYGTWDSMPASAPTICHIAAGCGCQYGSSWLNSPSWTNRTAYPFLTTATPIIPTTSSTWFGSAGAMTMNWTEANENITATTTFTDYGNDWLGSATSTIPGCYLQSTFGFMDFFKGLTAGDMSAQTLAINYGSSTIELDMSEIEFPPEFERYKAWFWNVFEVLGFLGLCILAVTDFINGYRGKDELSDNDD